MKAIVEQYAKGEFRVDRPLVAISEECFKLNIEAGTTYEGSFSVESKNDIPIKGMVYDSRYLLRFETHSFVSRRFDVRFSFNATCLEAGQTFRGHINVITDGGEFRIPYDISIVMPYVKYHDDKIDDLFKFAALAERSWKEAVRLFTTGEFRRTFIDNDNHTRQIYESLLASRSVDQAMEEFLVMIHKKRTVTLTVSRQEIDTHMPEEMSQITVEINKNTWGYTMSEISSNAEFIIPGKKTISEDDFTGNICELPVYISPEHVPEGENRGKLIIENIYQRIEVDIHLTKPQRDRPDREDRNKKRLNKSSNIKLMQAYLDFRMERIGLNEYVSSSIDALKTLVELEPEEDMYRLGIMHMNILAGDLAKVEQEFLRIEADVDRNLMSNQQRCYYSYLRSMVLKDEETIEKTANMIRRNFRTQEPKMFYFWLLLFVDEEMSSDSSALYRELSEMYEEGENSPIIYFELCEIFNANPLLLKKLTPFEITAIKWGIRHKFISDEVQSEFVKLAGKNADFNQQIFDVLKQVYDKNENQLKKERILRNGMDEFQKFSRHEKKDKDKAPEDVILADGLKGKKGDFESDLSDEFGISFEDDSEEKAVREDGDVKAEDGQESPAKEKKTLDKAVSATKYSGEISSAADFAEHYHSEGTPEEHTASTENYMRREQENEEVLRSLCSMLISANKLDHKYHRFYKAAVLKSMKFIGLNECYIRSMNHSRYDLIPASVLMYLNYKNTLNEEELAYLYANVIFNKAEHMKIYHEYAPTMEDFMENMIIKGKVNDDLTVIYDEFLEPESVSSLFAGKLINIIFRRKIVCLNKNVRAVIVTHEELRSEERIPLVNGEAYVEILSDGASIIFEDKSGNRYAGSIPYHFERIVDEKAYMHICREYSPRDYRVLLFNYKSIGEFTYKNAKEVNAAREIINCDEISYHYKQQACMNIIEYYHENLDTDVLRKYLNRLDIEYLTHANTSTIISYLIDMNMYDKAFQAVKLYGFNELEIDELYRLADYGVKDSDGFINEDLMSICLNLYKTGTVNANILSYIINHFNGSIDELAALFKLAKDRVTDVTLLAENTLAQMMFVKGYLEYIYDIFATYYSGRSRGLVVKAFLRMVAYNYLINDIQVPNYIFECMYHEIIKENIDDEISKMALLLFFSRLERFTDDQKVWIADTVEKFMDAGKCLPFYKSFAKFIRLPQDIFLKTYLVYKSEDDDQVFVNYSFDTGSRTKVATKNQRMEEVVPGVYVMEFVVFHGERLVYEIEGKGNGKAKIVESESLKTKSYGSKYKNRFETINSMLVKQEMREDRELLEDLDVYINTLHLFEENLSVL
ncbi:MAG: hypothetical protein IJJ74_06455 [Eubacterium sp.]|nr:hypothetical protein [Eubacterium sp.]